MTCILLYMWSLFFFSLSFSLRSRSLFISLLSSLSSFLSSVAYLLSPLLSPLFSLLSVIVLLSLSYIYLSLASLSAIYPYLLSLLSPLSLPLLSPSYPQFFPSPLSISSLPPFSFSSKSLLYTSLSLVSNFPFFSCSL